MFGDDRSQCHWQIAETQRTYLVEGSGEQVREKRESALLIDLSDEQDV